MKGMWRCILPSIMDQSPKLELTTRTIACQDTYGSPVIIKTAGEPVGYLRTKTEAHAALMVIAGAMPGLPE